MTHNSLQIHREVEFPTCDIPSFIASPSGVTVEQRRRHIDWHSLIRTKSRNQEWRERKLFSVEFSQEYSALKGILYGHGFPINEKTRWQKRDFCLCLPHSLQSPPPDVKRTATAERSLQERCAERECNQGVLLGLAGILLSCGLSSQHTPRYNRCIIYLLYSTQVQPSFKD